MRPFAFIIICCLVIAAAQAAIAVLALAITLTFIWALYARTAQTVGFLTVGGLTYLASAYPKTAIATGITCAAYFMFRQANHSSESQTSGPDSGEVEPSGEPAANREGRL
jgi:hypothetical protein